MADSMKVKIIRTKRPTPQDMRERAIAEIKEKEPDIKEPELNARLRAMGDLGGFEPVISISVPRADRAPDQVHLDKADSYEVDPDTAALAIATGGWEQAPDSGAKLKKQAEPKEPVKTE